MMSSRSAPLPAPSRAPPRSPVPGRAVAAVAAPLPVLFPALASMALLLSLQLLEVTIEAGKSLLPVAPVTLGPLRHLLQRPGLQLARPRLAAAAATDESSALEHFEMLGNCRLTHGKRFSELHHARLPVGEPREDSAARRVGERGEGLGEVPTVRHFITCKLYN